MLSPKRTFSRCPSGDRIVQKEPGLISVSPESIFQQKVYNKHNIAIKVKDTETEYWVENIHVFECVLTLLGDV